MWDLRSQLEESGVCSIKLVGFYGIKKFEISVNFLYFERSSHKRTAKCISNIILPFCMSNLTIWTKEPNKLNFYVKIVLVILKKLPWSFILSFLPLFSLSQPGIYGQRSVHKPTYSSLLPAVQYIKSVMTRCVYQLCPEGAIDWGHLQGQCWWHWTLNALITWHIFKLASHV